jgi:hypothetical protein
VLRQADEQDRWDRLGGKDRWDRTKVAGQSWQERYNWTVKKDRENNRTAGTEQARQDNLGKTGRKNIYR